VYAIDTDQLVRSFKEVTALDGLSLRVPAGSVFGLLGPNGSGKTTTIRILLGLLRPSSGEARVLGLDVATDGDEIRAKTGVVLEHDGLDERLSAMENLEFWARIWHLDSAQRGRRVEELLRHIGLWDRRSDRVGSWSHGMRRRLALARAVLPRPRLLILDEPTSGLDVASSTALRRDLISLAASAGTTVFLSTHNMVEAEQVCEQVAIIRAGRLVVEGSPRDLRLQAQRPRIVIIGRGLGDSAADLVRGLPQVAAANVDDGRLEVDLTEAIDPAPLVAMLMNAGVSIEEVHREAPSLEEVFLHLTEEEPLPGEET
jgi:ABC-2 type transport system ATP-binding protein